jgi:hypothetical protein
MDSAPVVETAPVSVKPRELARSVPLTYGAILICFLFTFINISCQKQRFVSLTGVQLAFGTTIETPKMFGGTEKKKIDPAPLVTFSLIAAVAGLVLSLSAAGRKLSVFAGAAGFVLLMIYKSNTDRDVLREGGGLIQVDYGGGFIIAVILFAAAAVLGSGIADRFLRGDKGAS